MSQSKVQNEGLREAAAVYAKQRSNRIAKTLRNFMQIIDREMNENDNIYPHNGGKLNQRELCRRASISFMTLQSPAHRETTRKLVNAWLESKSIVTKKTAAKAVSGRTDHWKEQHRLVATQIHVYELELKEKDLVIQSLRQQAAALEAQLAQTKKGHVISIAKNTSPEG